jgi:hypothetical protein
MSTIIFKDIPISHNAVMLEKATIQEVAIMQELQAALLGTSGESAATIQRAIQRQEAATIIQEAAQRYVLGKCR